MSPEVSLTFLGVAVCSIHINLCLSFPGAKSRQDASFEEWRHDASDAEDRVARDAEDVWTICTDEAPNDQFLWPTVGNGHVATVVRSHRVFMNGLYNGRGIESKRARIPAFTSTVLDGSALNDTAKSYCLNMDKGLFTERYVSDHWSVEVVWYAHRSIQSLLVNDIRVQADGQQESFELGVTVNVGNASEGIDFENGTSEITNARYVHGKIKIPETDDSGRTPVHIYYTVVPGSIEVPGHEVHNITLRILASVSPFKDTAMAAYRQGMRHGDGLVDLHINKWRDIWERGRLDIGGRPDLATAAYSALYYMISSMPVDVEDTSWPFIGLSPGDLAHGPREEEYKGHVFWDQDTWMFPPILVLHADLGKTLIKTRTRTLDAAFAMARQGGYEGAKYPWESAFTGFETCPGPIYSKLEIHISGDVAMATQQYLSMTRDTELLRSGRLMEQVLGIADFWKSRVVFNETRGLYDIYDVMPPDEWNRPVNNSAYTNAIAQKSLLLPKFALGLLGENVPPDYERVAKRMYIPFDEERQFHPEFDGYTDNITVKQADVILMGFPLEVEMTKEQRRNDLIIYANVTPAGPAMTWSMFCIGWLELDEMEKAEETFNRQLLNKREPFNVWSEYSDGEGAKNFITGQGGFLQSLLFGYGGLRIFEDKIALDCKPIPGTTDLRIKGLDYLGNSVDIICDVTSISLTLRIEAVPLDAVLTKKKQKYRLRLDKTLTFDRQPLTIIDSRGTSNAPTTAAAAVKASLVIFALIVTVFI